MLGKPLLENAADGFRSRGLIVFLINKPIERVEQFFMHPNTQHLPLTCRRRASSFLCYHSYCPSYATVITRKASR